MRRRRHAPPRARRFWIAALLLVIGVASYRIGLQVWGDYQLAQAERAIEERDFAKAHSALDRCLWLWPDKPYVHLLAGRTARREGRWKDARVHLQRGWNAPETRDAAGLEIRLMQVASGDLRNTPDLTRLRLARPNSVEAALIAEAQINGSLAALDPHSALALLDWWDEHRTSTADRVQGLVWRAEAYDLARNRQRAREACHQAVDLDPNHRRARQMLAQLLLHDAPQEASGHLAPLLARFPDDPDLLFDRARVERNLGQAEQARRTLDQILANQPNWIEAIVERGMVELDLRQTDAAGAWFRRAEQLSPKHRAVLLALVEYYRQAGQTDDMQRYEKRFAEVEAEARQRLQMAFEAQGRAAPSPASADSSP